MAEIGEVFSADGCRCRVVCSLGPDDWTRYYWRACVVNSNLIAVTTSAGYVEFYSFDGKPMGEIDLYNDRKCLPKEWKEYYPCVAMLDDKTLCASTTSALLTYDLHEVSSSHGCGTPTSSTPFDDFAEDMVVVVVDGCRRLAVRCKRSIQLWEVQEAGRGLRMVQRWDGEEDVERLRSQWFANDPRQSWPDLIDAFGDSGAENCSLRRISEDRLVWINDDSLFIFAITEGVEE